MRVRHPLPDRLDSCSSGALLTGAIVFFFSIGAFAETVDGFVTELSSPTDFRLGALHVVIDGKTQCAMEALDSDIELQQKTFDVILSHDSFGLRSHPDSRSETPVACSSLPLRVGSHVEVTGADAGSEATFHAAQVTAYDVTINHMFATETAPWDWEGGALLEEQPQVLRAGKGWTGTIWLDGYPMAVTPATDLLAAPNGAKTGLRPSGILFANPTWDAHPARPVPAFTGSLFQPNTWVVYRGAGRCSGEIAGECGDRGVTGYADRGAIPARGQISLDWARLWPNQMGEKEKEFVARLAPLVHAPDYLRHLPGTIRLPGQSPAENLKILPARDVQEFVSDLGESVMPEYQRQLKEQDDTKIHFHFYVVQGERPVPDDAMSEVDGPLFPSRNGLNRGAVALPNGVIVLPDYMLARIGNAAQLASILSYAVTRVLQEQDFVSHNSSPGSTWSIVVGPDYSWALFPLQRSEQALRIGIRQMYLAGYDIREVPFAWAAAAGKPVANPLADPAQFATAVPWYAAYVFDYISLYYSDVDYGKLKKGETEYAEFLSELRKAAPEAFEKK